MGLQSHAFATLEDEFGMERGWDMYWLDSNILAVECIEGDGPAVMRALRGEFNPELLDDLGPDGIVIRFNPLPQYVRNIRDDLADQREYRS